MTMLKECTKGPWYPGHLGDDTTPCNCTSIVDEGYAGGIARVNVDNGISRLEDGANDCPPLEQAKANMLLLAAAYDHALIGWALIHGGWETLPVETGSIGFAKLGEGVGLGSFKSSDPFGFPILTDDLRACLIAEMESTA